MTFNTGIGEYSFELRTQEEDPSYDHNLDIKIFHEIWTENVYRITDTQFYGQGVFVDIGANIGMVSLFVDSFNKTRGSGDKIKIIAVEPQPDNLVLLKNNIKNNGSDNIVVVENAIWHEEKEMSITSRGGNSSIVNLENEDYNSISAITMQQLFSLYGIEQVDLMKIDIEGAEFDLIINTPPETLAKIKYLVLEFDKSFDGRFGKMVEKLAKQFGLDILGSPERGGYIYANRY